MTDLIDVYTSGTLTAKIYQDDEGYFVEFWSESNPVKQVNVREHSLRYAEDAAENWIAGLIKA